MSDLTTVLRDLGNVFIAVGIISFFPLIVPIYFQEYTAIIPLIFTALAFLELGMLLYFVFRKSDPANFKSAMVTAALCWLFIPLVSIIPFLMIPYHTPTGAHMDILSSYFESMSGWTGTGLTMVDYESLLPYTLQFWRSWIQWIGGVGVIVLTLSILAQPGVGSYVLYRGEARERRTHPSIVASVRTIWWIFLFYTLVGFLVVFLISWLLPNGMNPWEIINHTMTALATGGFSVTDDSIAGFSTSVQLAMVVLMCIGATAFIVHYDLLKKRVRRFFSDAQLKAMIVLIILGVLVLVLININDPTLMYRENPLHAVRDAGFQFVSALTCTGLQTVDIRPWTESAKFLLSIAMIIGGAAGSTAGGIKLFRAILLGKGTGWRIKRTISTPRRIFIRKFGNRALSTEESLDLVNEAAIVSFMWVLILVISFFLIGVLYPSETIGNLFLEICSAQGNVGLSIGLTSISMEPLAKILLIFNMWIGRLEIIPVIVLVRSLFGIKRNLL
ncbi:MAG: TrkH family potassium uptake protein [Candidatus Thermoplasmatota archaeon]|nr:TrkH family potassium uptake protein [Candidatus Thermoplasmatota archaeon]